MEKLVSEVAIKSNGEIFLEILSDRAHHISGMSPDEIQHCGLLHGDWGQVGSVLCWNYTHDKLVKFRVVEGDIMEAYTSFCSTIQVKNKGAENFIVWTLDFEKSNPNDPDPHTLMELALRLTKDFDAHFN